MPWLARASSGSACTPLVSTYVAAAKMLPGETGVFPLKLANNTLADSPSTRTAGDKSMSRNKFAVDASSATVGLSTACAETRVCAGGSTSAPAGAPPTRGPMDLGDMPQRHPAKARASSL